MCVCVFLYIYIHNLFDWENGLCSESFSDAKYQNLTRQKVLKQLTAPYNRCNSSIRQCRTVVLVRFKFDYYPGRTAKSRKVAFRYIFNRKYNKCTRACDRSVIFRISIVNIYRTIFNSQRIITTAM